MTTARKSPENARFVHGGIIYRLTLERGTWRMRRRTRRNPVDFATGTANLAIAKQFAREHLDKMVSDTVTPCARTLADVVAIYRAIPKRAGQKAEDLNVMWLKCIVREAWGRELAGVRVDAISPALWRDFMAKRQGGKLDLATRREGNAAINTAVRCAASIFIKRLRPLYRERGIVIPEEVSAIQWLPIVRKPPAEVDGVKLTGAILDLASDAERAALWRTVAAARFAGLRRNEIMALRGSWYAEHRAQPVIELRDRVGDGFRSKTGRIYRAAILNDELAKQLRECPKDALFVQPVAESRERWFAFEPQKWLKPLMVGVQKPLHRLRGLYADELAALTEDATLAKLTALRAASEALGHTSTKTTNNSYLSDALR